jgi:HAD superfamily hydrolase (TIGR01509 family)
VRFSSISETHWSATTHRARFRWCCADAYGSVHGHWAKRRILPGTKTSLRARYFSIGSNPTTPSGRLADRLRELFGEYESLDEASALALGTAFLKPIFAMARLDPQAVPLLEALRGRGIKTAIVSNTPWGSPAYAWRAELERHGLLDTVDATVFCMDVGWRKPHRAPFDRALSLLDVAPADALFVGDDHRWDIVGAQNAGLRPVLLESVVPTPRHDHLTIPNLAGIIALLTEASV